MLIDQSDEEISKSNPVFSSGKVVKGNVVPTIKPGVHVRIIDAMDPRYIGMESVVERVSKYSPVSVKLKGIVWDWPLSSLEVVE